MEQSNNSFALIYPQLADRLAEQLPELWIDLDQDQLENEDQEYALPYDTGVLLISFDEVTWQDLGAGTQRGDAVIRFTLALQVVQDTYQHSAQRAAAMQKLELLGRVHAALQHFTGPGFGSLVREYSRKEPRPQLQQSLWVYSQGYRSRISDDEGAQDGSLVAYDVDVATKGKIVARVAADPEQDILL